ncbi:TRAP transporter large permease [Halomonas heilongjiangensis]|uniref:TRAP transporter large permease protein n=1 Tax=Halomonas heilongjiangensis TaxID=1387883 RepID=A0A2N7TVG2_9GAMM|nr:TRAP transporter large permease [Halomonas heilongjiangensis]PMR72183.1 TRAP transporter large permease [Halomonas heilongjiangensis]PXX91434.1 transporter [Halomonas heilongjiangensis]
MIAMSLAFVAMLIIGVPIVFALGIAGAVGLWALDLNLITVPTRLFTGMDNFVLLAAPFYIFAGEIMNRGGITTRLIRLAGLVTRGVPGGTAYTNVSSSVLFAGISGAAVADTAALGQIFIKGMPEEGYDKNYAAAVTIASSIIGPIVPPSVIMIIYAAVTRQSVIDLFVAGIVPGLMLAGVMWLVIWWQARGGRLPRSSFKVERHEVATLVRDGLLVMGLPILIVGGTLSGIFTATEAGGVAVVYALIISWFVFRTMDLASLWDALKRSARVTATIYLIIAAATVVSYVLTIGGIGGWVQGFAMQFADNPTLFLMVLVGVLLLVGTFLEPGAAIVLIVPMLMPVTASMDIDPLQFAMVVILPLTLGLITPPVGVCLFVACRIAESPVFPIFRAVLPFLVAEIGVVIMLVFVPALSSFLPTLLR